MKNLILGLGALAFSMCGLKTATQESRQAVEKFDKAVRSNISSVSSVNKIRNTHNTIKMFRDEGIPPKIYGMYYVKRGTHKRTNK
ncbi:hypothetical protein [Riemerella anatipestifer]|uniref:hypothetical protein n=1 Tax=Riemerella anatipestifer TaxID=34085 RepID=UPI0013734D24|nr:hypothetical protein [Riemerella anatipestifer]MBT0550239.1 hypothetical protein [Riemerella anatipestifer]MBT0556963.1 hypothetical protein [Riemerella anatipestifer]MBT0560999.1 hypothetical protein [Riemerella anatipestifer]NAV17330.1 hypothetical protein [Riemerella anatipestifer]